MQIAFARRIALWRSGGNVGTVALDYFRSRFARRRND